MSDHSQSMNPAALASELMDADARILEALLAFETIFARLAPGTPAAYAVQHAMDTLALLSAATEDLVSQVVQNGAENPSWN